MAPRKSTDFGAMFDAIVEDLRMQVAASVDRTLSDLERRLARIERRLDQLDPERAKDEPAATAARRPCVVCDRPSVARGLCSAHYQQWRYRSRKTQPHAAGSAHEAAAHDDAHEHVDDSAAEATPVPPVVPVSPNLLSSGLKDVSRNN